MVYILVLSLVMLVSAAGARAQATRATPAISISLFGAAGDGVTDDTKAFVAAISAAAKTGATLQLGNSTYLLTSTLVIAHPDISIVGRKHTTLLFAPDHPLGNGILITGVSRVELESFTLRGARAGLHTAIGVHNASNIRLDHLRIEGIHGPGISALSAVLLARVDRIWISNCTITDVGLGPGQTAFIIWNYYKLRSQQVHIERNHIFGNTASIIMGMFDTDHGVVDNNTIDGGDSCYAPCNNNGYGILFYRTIPGPAQKGEPPPDSWPAPIDERIANNLITNTGGSAIYLQRVHGATVVKNRILNTSLRMIDVSLPTAGIALNGSNDIRILDNTINRSNKAGVALATTQRILVEGNTIQNVATSGIHLRVAQVGTVIRANTITDSPLGIMIEKDAVDTTLEGNIQKRVHHPVINRSAFSE